MLLSAVSVLVVAQSNSEIPEGLMNNPVYIYVCVCVCVCIHIYIYIYIYICIIFAVVIKQLNFILFQNGLSFMFWAPYGACPCTTSLLV